MFTRIYALAVCFASIICIAISTGVGLYDIVQISFPALTMDSYLYQSLQSNEVFRRSHLYTNPMPIYPGTIQSSGSGMARAMSLSKVPDDDERLSDEDIGERRRQQLATTIDYVRHDAQRSLLQILIILLVSIPLFIIHWRYAQKLDST
jgi:hypothetical protein